MTHTIQHGPGGWFIEWYRDDDGDSGYGQEAEVAFWYGGRGNGHKMCIERAKRPPNKDWWVSISLLGDNRPLYTHVTE